MMLEGIKRLFFSPKSQLSSNRQTSFERMRAARASCMIPDEVEVGRALAKSLTGKYSSNRQIREVLAAASRTEDQRSGYYCGMLNRVARDRVGRGPKLRPMFENEQWNLILSQQFHAWMRATKFGRNLRAAIRDAARDGAALGIKYTKFDLSHQVKLDIRFIDSMRLKSPFLSALPMDRKHADGIDLDDNDNPIRYWIDSQSDIIDVSLITVEEARPYNINDVLHYFTKRTSEQQHGLPEASAGLLLIPNVRRYVMGVIRNCEQAANIVYTLSNENAISDEETMPFELYETEPGMIQELPPGKKLNAVVPQQPHQQHETLVNSMVNEAACCFDMPLLLAIGNASDSTFSSANIDLMPYEESTLCHREDIACDLIDPVFDAWYEEAILIEDYLPRRLRQLYPTGQSIPHLWGWNRIRFHPDPSKDAAAKEMNLANGITTLTKIYEETGDDARQILESEARLLGVSYEEYASLILQNRFGGQPANAGQQRMAELLLEK